MRKENIPIHFKVNKCDAQSGATFTTAVRSVVTALEEGCYFQSTLQVVGIPHELRLRSSKRILSSHKFLQNAIHCTVATNESLCHKNAGALFE